MAATNRNLSPAKSPRLPSPPPFPEVQLPPASPGMPATSIPDNVELSAHDENSDLRRIRPGTKAAGISAGPPLTPLHELDSPFQLQEHLKSLHSHHTKSSIASDASQPITARTAVEIATPPSNVDRSLWLYELTRFLVMRANDLIVSFFRENPPCSAVTCPEMRASEWQYLCAVHEPPKPCCAIDYSCHTLDWAAYTLTSQKQFPSRLTPLMGDEPQDSSLQQQQQRGSGGVRQLTNIMRRVYRIFAHAWFQHRGVFWDVEGREGLYILFKTVCDMYGLIPEENYTIPKEAEGSGAGDGESTAESDRMERTSPEKMIREGDALVVNDEATSLGGNLSSSSGPGATQRRHKSSPSVGSAVSTIQEGDEEDAKVTGSAKSSPKKSKAVAAAASSQGGNADTSEQIDGTNETDKPADSSTDAPAMVRDASTSSVATMVKVEEVDEDKA